MAAGELKRKQPDELCMSSHEVHAKLRARYGLDSNEWADKEIRDVYMRGLHSEISGQVLQYLEDKFGTQSRVAEFLGVDRTAISKMKASRRVNGKYLSLAFIGTGFEYHRDQAARGGLIEAAYYVRTVIQKDTACKNRMTEGDYSELLLGIQNEWYEAFILALMEVEDFIAQGPPQC